MIPVPIAEYLQGRQISFTRHAHPRAYTAQQVAASLHVTGHRFAKSVIVLADGRPWIAVLPANEIVDEAQLAQVLGARTVRLAAEAEFANMFPGVEVGAEPPFGNLYGLPVVVDRELAREERVIFRAGSHEEALEMRYQDFASLERPVVGPFGRLQGVRIPEERPSLS